MVLVSVSTILIFTFRHLVISGVSCYSCLCLEIVPLVILLHYISRPGRLALFPEFQWSEQSLQASSPLSGRCIVIWCLDLLLAKDEGPKQDLSQKLCYFVQEGGWLSGAEDGAASEALWLSPDPETDGLCIPHPHPCSLPSAESRNQGGSRWSLRQKPLGPGGPLCSHEEGGQLSLSQSSYLFREVLPSTFCLCYRPLAFFPFSFFKKNYLFYVYEYTVTVFRHTRRGHQIPLQVVGSHHVVAGN